MVTAMLIARRLGGNNSKVLYYAMLNRFERKKVHCSDNATLAFLVGKLCEVESNPLEVDSAQQFADDKPLVKFEVGPGLPSRYQLWKFHVWPAVIATGPVGVGVPVRSSASAYCPPLPEVST